MAYKRKEYIYNDKLSNDENLLIDRLYKLRLSFMAEALEKQFLDPNSDLESFMPRISEVINCKCQYKNVGKVENKNVGFSTHSSAA